MLNDNDNTPADTMSSAKRATFDEDQERRLHALMDVQQMTEAERQEFNRLADAYNAAQSRASYYPQHN
jgi:hypothetical protein